jgi:cell division protein FtsZ
LELSVEGAKGVLFNVTGGRDLGMHEIDQAAKVITDAVDPDAQIIFGAVIDDSLAGDMKITVIATGFDGKERHPASNPLVKPETRRVEYNSDSEDDELDVPAFIRRQMQ